MSEAASITVRVPLAIRRRPGRKTVVTPTGEIAAPARTHSDPALLKALARAFRWQKLLDEGRYASIRELAAAEKIERGYLGSVLKLTLLAPWVVEAIVDGRSGDEIGPSGLMDEVHSRWLPQPDRSLATNVQSQSRGAELADCGRSVLERGAGRSGQVDVGQGSRSTHARAR